MVGRKGRPRAHSVAACGLQGWAVVPARRGGIGRGRRNASHGSACRALAGGRRRCWEPVEPVADGLWIAAGNAVQGSRALAARIETCHLAPPEGRRERPAPHKHRAHVRRPTPYLNGSIAPRMACEPLRRRLKAAADRPSDWPLAPINPEQWQRKPPLVQYAILAPRNVFLLPPG